MAVLQQAGFCEGAVAIVAGHSAEHLVAAPAGVRAQALSPDGTLVDDFLVQPNARIVNVGNAPSPAATASLNVGSLVVDRLVERIE